MKRKTSATTSPYLVDRGTTRDEAMALVSRLGDRGREVRVPCDCLPVLGLACAPRACDSEGRLFYRFPPARRKAPPPSTTGRLLALAALTGASPLLLLIALALFLTNDRGTGGERVFFRQIRRGAGRSTFRICKFRTLSGNRPLPLGRWLRSHGLDELPQLWNILRGEMAWFGPRPLPKDDRLPGFTWIGERFSVRPGLTGLYQCCPGRRNLSIEEMTVLDLFWIRNNSPRLNIRLLVKTASAVFGGWGRENER